VVRWFVAAETPLPCVSAGDVMASLRSFGMSIPLYIGSALAENAAVVGVSTPHAVTGDRDANELYAAWLSAAALAASLMTPATTSGRDSIRRWEAPSTSVTLAPARS
jgi:hypothetical protein